VESKELTVIQPKVLRIAHLAAFPTPKIGLTGMVISKIQMKVKKTVRQTINSI